MNTMRISLLTATLVFSLVMNPVLAETEAPTLAAAPVVESAATMAKSRVDPWE